MNKSVRCSRLSILIFLPEPVYWNQSVEWKKQYIDDRKTWSKRKSAISMSSELIPKGVLCFSQYDNKSDFNTFSIYVVNKMTIWDRAKEKNQWKSPGKQVLDRKSARSQGKRAEGRDKQGTAGRDKKYDKGRNKWWGLARNSWERLKVFFFK